VGETLNKFFKLHLRLNLWNTIDSELWVAAKRGGLIKSAVLIKAFWHNDVGGLKIIPEMPEFQSKTSGMFYWFTVYILNCSFPEISFK